MSRVAVGDLLAGWRHRRRRSQLEVAIGVGVSARHLSFVETGRSRPSPELVLALADHLDVPLRDRNTMLLAAGYAPRYSQTPLDDVTMVRIRASLQRLLDAHDPYPGVVIDRQWNVVLANQAAQALTAGVPAHVRQPVLNVFRVCLHPDGLPARTLNFEDWASYLLRQLRRLVQITGDPALEALEGEVHSYPGVGQVQPVDGIGLGDDLPLLVPFTLAIGEHELSLFTTLTTFGTPQDVTLDELSVELFFPADDAADALLLAGDLVPAGSPT